MKKIIAMGLVTACAVASHGTTIELWDFDDGVAGQSFTPTNLPNGTGGSIGTVNGTLMRGWNTDFGPSFYNDAGNTVMRNSTQDGYVTEGVLHNWSPTAWTIETSVYLNGVDGWNTIIGRDGSSQAEAESDFYLTNNGIDDSMRINIDTVGGTRWILDGNYTIQADTWYGLAARSDGVTLDLLLDDYTAGTGYQLIGSLDISAQTVADNALPGTALNWTFGRGWFGGSFVDHIDGRMDNVRFSDTALDSSELIAVIPEPATLGLLGTFGAGLLFIRRRFMI